MAKPLVSDELWELVQPLLPPERPKPKGGRPRVPDRAALGGILFILKTGTGWENLPQEMGCGSGMTCWRRLRDWQQAGVWERIHLACLERLQASDGIDWSPDWSPDGAQIVFISSRSGNEADIFVMNADGSNVTQLTDHSGAQAKPAWSPDGTQIVFAREVDLQIDLFVMNADGSGVAPIAEGTGDEQSPDWQALQVAPPTATAPAPTTTAALPTTGEGGGSSDGSATMWLVAAAAGVLALSAAGFAVVRLRLRRR